MASDPRRSAGRCLARNKRILMARTGHGRRLSFPLTVTLSARSHVCLRLSPPFLGDGWNDWRCILPCSSTQVVASPGRRAVPASSWYVQTEGPQPGGGSSPGRHAPVLGLGSERGQREERGWESPGGSTSEQRLEEEGEGGSTGQPQGQEEGHEGTGHLPLVWLHLPRTHRNRSS